MNNLKLRVITSFFLITFFLVLFFLPSFALFVTFFVIMLSILLQEWYPLCKKNYYLFFLTPIYPIIPMIFLLYLITNKSGELLFFFTFLLVAVFDIASFTVGSLFGKNAIAESISPKKTWEGFLGGMLTVLIIGRVMGEVFTTSMTYGYFIHLFFIGLCAFLGDLFESYLKRKAFVKDSGSILPGHGGLLDRFDSLLGAIIYVYLFQQQLVALINI